jgi:hypothetical protein
MLASSRIRWPVRTIGVGGVRGYCASWEKSREWIAMKIRFVLYVLAGLFLVITQANARIYTYASNPDPYSFNGNYLTAEADLNCLGSCASGTYTYGAGINSFSLAIHDNTGANLLTISTADAGAFLHIYTDYLTFDGAGNVTHWFLFLCSGGSCERSTEISIYTIGDDPTYGWQDYGYDFTVTPPDLLYDTRGPGVWSLSSAPVPEPETYAMLLAGLGLLGLTARRRKQKLNA